MDKGTERSNHAKIQRRVAVLLLGHGFQRSKKSFFIRPQQLVIEFFHLHKYSFEPSYRIHLGIRVLNGQFTAEALNGPDSHAYTCIGSPNGSRYAFNFGDDIESVTRCSAEISRWCTEVGLPWFDRFRDPDALLTESDSPLDGADAQRLIEARAGRSDPDTCRASRQLFGL